MLPVLDDIWLRQRDQDWQRDTEEPEPQLSH